MRYSLRILFVLVALAACGAMLTRHLMRERTSLHDGYQTIDVDTTDNAIVIDIHSRDGFKDICWITVAERLRNGAYGITYTVRRPFQAVVLDEFVHATIRISLDGQSNEGDINLLQELQKQKAEIITFKKLSNKPLIHLGKHRIDILDGYQFMIASGAKNCYITIYLQ